ncbi:uncharacterized protein EV420DRAFT_716756 [Desarmillaria tabescens]|uniref:Oxidoreductase AflY n=1 Tax=Armillaria tabescens TaxID=1929756 RepID=A0AA39JYT0_ARMTA|nr:uncharacterized protein EV420DRAFT_716756 [Desarmillaria tabescens]KAK0451420.1 hypothetical protein EV420DRAFT_716756 [Desarmillaria tabescens]
MSTATFEWFPSPAILPTNFTPNTIPGVDAESTLSLQNVLRDNHEKWHVFFNHLRFHNHITHHVLAIWALGANKKTIEAVYQEYIPMQRPAIKSPNNISSENFTTHLGDDQCRTRPFSERTSGKKDSRTVLEEFVFSPSANVSSAGDKQPAMLKRLLSGLVHPIIHTGYGLEFGLPGMVVEGLAQAAVHHDQLNLLFPPSFFEPNVDTLAEKVSANLTLDSEPSDKTEIHAFDILARVLKNDTLKYPDTSDPEFFAYTLRDNGATLLGYANQWSLGPKDIYHKIEELQWMNTVLYAITGSHPGKKFYADFFYMHLVTSSLFLPSFAAYLTPPSQALLLRSYMAVSLAWWVARGRPGFDIPKFFEVTIQDSEPSSNSSTPTWNLPSATNPWFAIIQQAIVHPDDHLCKIQRAFVHYATLYGARPCGKPDFSQTELEGAERLDGTLFLRAAQLTAKHFEYEGKGEKYPAAQTLWDFS